MVSYDLKPSCEPSKWVELDDKTKLRKQLVAFDKPSEFWGDPTMGNHPLWPEQVKILDKFYAKDKEGKRKYNELLFDAGRQGGKTFTAAFILCTELYRLLMLPDPHKYYNISRARDIVLFMSAAGATQTLTTIFPTVKNLIEISPFLSQYADQCRATTGVIKFPKKITIEAVGSNVKTAVGRTVKAYVAEEVNSVGTDMGNLTPGEQYHKLSKSTTMFMPFGEDIRVAISSKTSGYDFLSQTIMNAKENHLDRTLIIQKTTEQLNPHITKEVLEEERLRDEDSYEMEYFGRGGVGHRFFKRVVSDRIKFHERNIFTIPQVKTSGEFVPDFISPRFEYDNNSTMYILGLDPSSINDPFGVSVVHYTTDDQIVVDGATCFRPDKKREIDPSRVRMFLEHLISVVPFSYCAFDIALYNETRQMIESKGVQTVKHIVNLDDWNQFKNQCVAGLVHMPHESYLINELEELVVKNNKVDHPPSGTKDILDSICNAATLMFREEGPEHQGLKYYGGLTFVNR